MQALAITEAATKNSGSSWGSLIWIVLLVLVLGWFLTTRRRQKAAQQEKQSALGPGTRVITTAGLHGTVVEQDGGDVLLEVAPEVVLRFTRNAIARVLPDAAADADHDHDHDHADHDHDSHADHDHAEAGGSPGDGPSLNGHAPKADSNGAGSETDPLRKKL